MIEINLSHAFPTIPLRADIASAANDTTGHTYTRYSVKRSRLDSIRISCEREKR